MIIREAFRRHESGDWGDVCGEDREANERALEYRRAALLRVSRQQGRKFWIVTEADRSATTVLLPYDYWLNENQCDKSTTSWPCVKHSPTRIRVHLRLQSGCN